MKFKTLIIFLLFVFVNPSHADENEDWHSVFENKITPISGIVLVCKGYPEPNLNKPFCDERMFEDQMNLTRIHFVTREMLKEILDEKKLSLSGLTSKQQYGKIKSISEASHILDYNIEMDLSNKLIANMKLINIQTSEVEYSDRLIANTTVKPLNEHSPLMVYTRFFKMLDRHAEPATKEEASQASARSNNRLSAAEWLERGSEFDNSGKYSDAVLAFSKAIELNPQLADAYQKRAVAYNELGSNQLAMKDFDKAIKLNPQHADAYFNRGLLYGTMGKHQKEIENYDKVIKIDPNHSTAYFMRGHAYFMLGNRNKAKADVKKAAILGYKPAQDKLTPSGDIKW